MRSVPPSAMSLLGLVRHMAEVELGWFRFWLAGEKPDPRYDNDEEWDVDDADVDDAFGYWRSECETHARCWRRSAHSTRSERISPVTPIPDRVSRCAGSRAHDRGVRPPQRPRRPPARNHRRPNRRLTPRAAGLRGCACEPADSARTSRHPARRAERREASTHMLSGSAESASSRRRPARPRSRQRGDDRRDLLGRRVAADDFGSHHSGMLPCLRAGAALASCASIRSALASMRRVSRGSMTSST